MKRFKNILMVVDADAPKQDGLRRASELAYHNNAKLKIVDIVRPFGWLKRLTTAKYHDIEEKLVANKQHRLQALADSAWDRGPDVSTKVLFGSASTEIIREVLRHEHDLVMKEAKGEMWQKGFFGTTGMQLMRKCPCPVWLIKPGPHDKSERVLAAIDTACHDNSHAELNLKIMELATSFCERESSRLDVVQVWSLYGDHLLKSHMTIEEFDELVEASRIEAEQCCGQFLSKIEANIPSEHVHVRRGEPGYLIPMFAKQNNTDLIVMGTVARTGIAGALTGNTAEAILSKVQCSVLALKPAEFVCPITIDDG